MRVDRDRRQQGMTGDLALAPWVCVAALRFLPLRVGSGGRRGEER